MANIGREVRAGSVLTSGGRSGEASFGPSVPGSTSPQDGLSRSCIKDELKQCLSKVKYVGDILSHRTSRSNVDPGLHIKDVGDIKLPLESEGAKLIMRADHQPPSGQGPKTVLDTSSRNVKQLDRGNFELRNPAWSDYVQEIIKALAVGLGCQGSPPGIEAELHELLLYEEGGMFGPHTELRFSTISLGYIY